MDRTFPDGHTTLLAAFTKTSDHARVNIHLCLLQRNELGDTQACRVHQFEHRAIAQPFVSRDVYRREQPVDFFFSEKLGQVRKLLRCIKVLSGMVLDVAVKHKKAEEPARGAY